MHQEADRERERRGRAGRTPAACRRAWSIRSRCSVVERGVADLAADDEGEAAIGAHRPERHRQRRQPEAGDQHAVERAQHAAGQDHAGHGEPDRPRRPRRTSRRGPPPKARIDATRDVDLAEHHDDREAEREDSGDDEVPRRGRDLVEAQVVGREIGRPCARRRASARRACSSHGVRRRIIPSPPCSSPACAAFPGAAGRSARRPSRRRRSRCPG